MEKKKKKYLFFLNDNGEWAMDNFFESSNLHFKNPQNNDSHISQLPSFHSLIFFAFAISRCGFANARWFEAMPLSVVLAGLSAREHSLAHNLEVIKLGSRKRLGITKNITHLFCIPFFTILILYWLHTARTEVPINRL